MWEYIDGECRRNDKLHNIFIVVDSKSSIDYNVTHITLSDTSDVIVDVNRSNHKSIQFSQYSSSRRFISLKLTLI